MNKILRKRYARRITITTIWLLVLPALMAWVHVANLLYTILAWLAINGTLGTIPWAIVLLNWAENDSKIST